MTSATNIPVHVKKNRTAGDWAILILLIVGGLVMLFPFIVLLLNAFKTTADYNSSGPLSWPKEFSTVGLMKFWNRVNYPEKLWTAFGLQASWPSSPWCCPCSTHLRSVSDESRAVVG